MKQILILIIAVFAALPLQAQYEYTLKQCLEEGLLNNYSLAQRRTNQQEQRHIGQCGLSAYGRFYRRIYR